MNYNRVPSYIVNKQVSEALFEDLLTFSDYTSLLVKDEVVRAIIIAREDFILCGIDWVNQAFYACDNDSVIVWNYEEGKKIVKGNTVCQITGKARSLLTAERVALNFLQLLSATATITNKYVELVKGYNTKIFDTRKTIPFLRYAQKYAVKVGGGYNQRFGLYDGVLIKENHIANCGGVKNALKNAFLTIPNYVPVQIEVENFDQLVEAIENGAKLILLDNMSSSQIKYCVDYAKWKVVLEASGNINLGNIVEYAQTGVDRISVGSLTKNVVAIDLSMKFC